MVQVKSTRQKGQRGRSQGDGRFEGESGQAKKMKQVRLGRHRFEGSPHRTLTVVTCCRPGAHRPRAWSCVQAGTACRRPGIGTAASSGPRPVRIALLGAGGMAYTAAPLRAVGAGDWSAPRRVWSPAAAPGRDAVRDPRLGDFRPGLDGVCPQWYARGIRSMDGRVWEGAACPAHAIGPLT